jgi:hypothetical protein
VIPLATQVVHTAGINWDSISAIGALILAAVVAITSYIRRSIKTSVDHLADVLEARMASNASVDDLRDRVTVLETRAAAARLRRLRPD